MTEEMLTMSQKELGRLEAMQKIDAKILTKKKAGEILSLSSKQVGRLFKRYKKEGSPGLISRRRGKPSNYRLSAKLYKEVTDLIKTRYYDFGPTLAHEKLAELHNIYISRETARKWMVKAGIWKGRKRKLTRIHQQRARRSCLGELVQIDGSPHDWFEDRGPRCCLLVFIDDATSQLMCLHFAEEESTEAYFTATQAYLKRHGRPLCYYSDKHGIFRINMPEAAKGTGETQFGRAMRELDIKLICANSPQAKGRVERANGILQDRLIKEMRLKNISSIADANFFLPGFMENYNKRFAVVAADTIDAHRSSIPDDETCNLIFSQQHQRTISKNLEVSYKNILYQIQSNTPSYTMRRAKLTVCERYGEIALVYKGKLLSYKTVDKNNKPVEIISSKQLNRPKRIGQTKPQADHPWRNYPSQPSKQIQGAIVML